MVDILFDLFPDDTTILKKEQNRQRMLETDAREKLLSMKKDENSSVGRNSDSIQNKVKDFCKQIVKEASKKQDKF